MSENSSFLPMLLRAALLLALFLLPFALIGALALWPESEYARLWEIVLIVYSVLAFAAFFVTRARKKRRRQQNGS